MRRFTVAMTLGLGFGLTAAGCGPTAEEPGPKPASGVAEQANTKPPHDQGVPGPNTPSTKGDGGKSGMGGDPAAIVKGMETDEYRKASGIPPQPEGEKGKIPIPKQETTPPTDQVKANLDKLSPEDQKLAMEQKICPVGEDEGKPNLLGVMGVPIKETVKGKTVFLCCKSCIDELKKDPDKYLAKINK